MRTNDLQKSKTKSKQNENYCLIGYKLFFDFLTFPFEKRKNELVVMSINPLSYEIESYISDTLY